MEEKEKSSERRMQKFLAILLQGCEMLFLENNK
jgi:hypothetical protein